MWYHAPYDAVPFLRVRLDEVYHVDVEGQTVEVRLDGERLFVDDQERVASYEPLTSSSGHLLVDGKSVPVVLQQTALGAYRVSLHGQTVDTQVKTKKDLLLERYGIVAKGHAGEEDVRAPMPGLVLRVSVQQDAQVRKGDGLLVLEAMKMENELHAPCDGTVIGVHVKAGDAVGKQQLLIEIEAGDVP